MGYTSKISARDNKSLSKHMTQDNIKSKGIANTDMAICAHITNKSR